MDKNKDGVVTLDEFIIACQEVSIMQQHATLFLQNAMVQTYIIKTDIID